MSTGFDPTGRLVVIPVLLTGRKGEQQFKFAVDTAATRSAASGLTLEVLGYQRSQAVGSYQVRTGGGGNRTGLVRVLRVVALDQTRTDFPLLWQPIPVATMIDGLLGLDFFRGQLLALDFARGRVSLGPPKRWWQFWR